MKLGCCLNMFANDPDFIGSRFISVLKEAGYDYMELPLAQIMDLSEEAFEQLLNQVRESGVPCECCNNFFPASVRLTGQKADMAVTERYVAAAMERASRLGVRIIVFGSSGAKNVPQGFPMDQAYQQIISVLRMVEDYTSRYDITIAIEPLNTMESNIINTVAQGYKLMHDVARPHIRLLVDYYHFCLEHTPVQELAKYMDGIRHIHFANPDSRSVPLIGTEDYAQFFRIVRESGYDARVSVEAYSQNPAKDLHAALCLRSFF